jgi:N-acyl-D-aspartate/D-glutamate deacylase
MLILGRPTRVERSRSGCAERVFPMSRRLVVRGATVVDGSGMPGFAADVEVLDGVVRNVGRVDPSGAQVIDADGLVVAPGFVDIHTHYDAQLHFEPTASPSSWHGVTTVAIGNCGFSLAPCGPGDLPWMARMLSRVEGMSETALLAGVTFTGGSMADFLDGLEGQVGVNVAAYVGHCAIRRVVMGEAASERSATPDEIVGMARCLERALDDGALGLSTSQLDIHVDHEGRPVPSNLATHAELEALAAVLGTRPAGAVEIFPRSFVPGLDDGDRELVLRMAQLSGKPVHGSVLGYFASAPEGWRRNLAVAEEAHQRGLRYHPMLILNPKGVHFAFDSTFVFDEYPTWRAVLTLPTEQRLRALAASDTRATLGQELADPKLGSLGIRWDEVEVVWASREELKGSEGRSVEALAANRGADPLDTMLDLAIADELLTNFAIRRKTSVEERAVIDELVGHPLLTAGSSDGGAHLLTFCGADYTTRLIAEHVPERLSLEQAVSQLTFRAASALGLWNRGLLRPGFPGDLTIFDPEHLAVGRPELRHDFPTGAARLVFGALGYRATIVNGVVVVDDGEPTGERPGTVLRAGRLSDSPWQTAVNR